MEKTIRLLWPFSNHVKEILDHSYGNFRLTGCCDDEWTQLII